MKRIVQLLVFIFPVTCFSQGLLLNGNFEVENICTEYRINCAPEAWTTNLDAFSNYFKDPNRSYEGSHCMGIQVGHAYKPYQRTFLRSRLLCGLREGSVYRLEFYIKSFHPVLDSMGVYFGDRDPLLERKPIHLLAPSLRLIDQGNKFVRDSSWQKATLDYTAKGGEAYITIANFAINDIKGPTGIEKENNYYVYIDKVSLTALNPNEHICGDWETTKEDIYSEDARHEFLLRLIQYRRTNPQQPVKATPTIILAADTVQLPDLLFATGKKELKPGSLAVLDSFCAKMNGKQIDSLVIEGHTDNIGSANSNETLSVDRASSVNEYLLRCAALFRKPVILRGKGSSQPIVGNETAEGRQKNRRVEMRVYFRE